jgi:hypothetical protein
MPSPRPHPSTLAVLFALAACGGSSGRPDPTIAIVAPPANSSVPMGTDADKSVTITYALTNFTTMAPGTCGSTPSCGHLHLLIDGAACTPSGALYNNSSNSPTQALALFARCPTPAAQHTVLLELHDDVHNPVKTSSGQTVQASVTFTTN